MKNIIAENFLRFAPKNLSEADLQKISRITEAEAEIVNITLTGIMRLAQTKPTLVSEGTNTIITLGSDATDSPAINANQAVITYLGNYCYMILGNVGTFDVKAQVVKNAKTGMNVYDIRENTDPDAGQGEGGGFVKALIQHYNTFNPEKAIAKALALVYKDKGDGKEFYNKNKTNIASAFKMANTFGITQLDPNQIASDRKVLSFLQTV